MGAREHPRIGASGWPRRDVGLFAPSPIGDKYLVRVEFAQGLDGQHLLLLLPAQTQGQDLQAALLQGLDSLVEVVHGLGLVLRTQGNRQGRR